MDNKKHPHDLSVYEDYLQSSKMNNDINQGLIIRRRKSYDEIDDLVEEFRKEQLSKLPATNSHLDLEKWDRGSKGKNPTDKRSRKQRAVKRNKRKNSR